jgi:hypothetical protein
MTTIVSSAYGLEAPKDGTVRSREPINDHDPNISSVLSLAKYERDGEEDDYRHRMIMNGLALFVIAALIVAGVWLTANASVEAEGAAVLPIPSPASFGTVQPFGPGQAVAASMQARTRHVFKRSAARRRWRLIAPGPARNGSG